VFFAGERIARKDFPGNAVSYYFSDHLKTASVITNSAGTISEDEDYYPWGGELQMVNNDSNHYKYGGHERDNETGLDYMLARYYSNPLARFLTPDWADHPTEVPYTNFGNPQSLNLYRYAQNNPTTFGDPDGHCPPCPVEEETGYVIAEEEAIGTATGTATATATVTAEGAAATGTAVAEKVAETGGRSLLTTVGAPLIIVGYLLFPGTGSSGKNSEVEWELAHKGQPQTQPTPTPQTQPKPQAPPVPQAAEHKKRKSSRRHTRNKHTKLRPGESKPPGYIPYREYEQPKDDKKKDRKKKPYHRKDRDVAPPV
jgi:RHS repeat-associated protein